MGEEEEVWGRTRKYELVNKKGGGRKEKKENVGRGEGGWSEEKGEGGSRKKYEVGIMLYLLPPPPSYVRFLIPPLSSFFLLPPLSLFFVLSQTALHLIFIFPFSIYSFRLPPSISLILSASPFATLLLPLPSLSSSVTLLLTVFRLLPCFHFLLHHPSPSSSFCSSFFFLLLSRSD